MERFRKFFGRELNAENIKDAGGIGSYGVRCTYLPEPPEDFDEFEFRTGSGGKGDTVITVTVEMGKIKRIMFGAADEKNPDIVKSLTEEQLAVFLEDRGEQLAGFFTFITL